MNSLEKILKRFYNKLKILMFQLFFPRPPIRNILYKAASPSDHAKRIATGAVVAAWVPTQHPSQVAPGSAEAVDG